MGNILDKVGQSKNKVCKSIVEATGCYWRATKKSTFMPMKKTKKNIELYKMYELPTRKKIDIHTLEIQQFLFKLWTCITNDWIFFWNKSQACYWACIEAGNFNERSCGPITHKHWSRKMQGINNLTKNRKCSLYHLHNTLGYSLLPLELHFFHVLDPHPLLAPLSVFTTPNIYSPISGDAGDACISTSLLQEGSYKSKHLLLPSPCDLCMFKACDKW